MDSKTARNEWRPWSWAMIVPVCVSLGCFPEPPECSKNLECPPSADPCTELVCIDRQCIEEPKPGVCEDSETEEAVDAEVLDTQDAEFADTEVLQEPDAEIDAHENIESSEADTELLGDDTDVDAVEVDLDTETRDGEAVGPELNACGGEGTLSPAGPGTACGACGDGAFACDDSDPLRRTTVCEGASALNACGGCGMLPQPLGSLCDTCGTWSCDPEGAPTSTCIEPVEGCTEPLTCDDLGCESQGRSCVETDGDLDAACAGCLPSHALVDDACVPEAEVPTGISVTSDGPLNILVSWSVAANATGYRVYRCDSSDCSDDDEWDELTIEPVEDTIFVDDSALGPALPPAPGTIAATQDDTASVKVTWSPVVAPLAPRYSYRATAVGLAGESEPSESAEGAREEVPITGYERRIGSGPWQLIAGGLVSQWVDTDAPSATLVAPTINVSQGVYADYVRLEASGAAANRGLTRDYQVRAITAQGQGTASATATGWRVAGGLRYQWQRSAGASADSFSNLPGADAPLEEDRDAPSDGAVRWYRVVVSADGTSDVTSSNASGSRLPPLGVPGNVSASSDIEAHVLVRWDALGGALGYHVYRNGVKLTNGTGITATTYTDTGAAAPSGSWQAPSGVTASTNIADWIDVQWTAPQRPLGTEAIYTVRAVNAAGEGPSSAQATGRRAAPVLTGYQVEVTNGASSSWVATNSTNATWTDGSAPNATIVGGSISVTQGAHRDSVKLAVTGAAVTPTNVSYRVRGVLQGGGYTSASTSVIGHRAVGPLNYIWQRSASTSPSSYLNLPSATAATFDDLTAPADGGRRWYQVILHYGANQLTVGPAEGWRLAFVAVDGGFLFTCALTTEGDVWCWGDNQFGQLGRGHTSATPNPAPIQRPASVSAFSNIAVGQVHACARTGQGEVWCWGFNGTGGLGDGTTTNKSVPTKVEGLAGPAISLDVSGHSCSVSSAGVVQCWGFNEYGKLGNNSTTDSLVPATVVVNSQMLPLAGGLSVSTGEVHSCARTASNVYCWGRNKYGELGVNVITESAVAVQTPIGPVNDITTGSRHTCVRLTGSIQCWGGNNEGQLGNGTTTDSFAHQAVPGLTTSTQVVAMYQTTCARHGSGGSLFSCWGDNGLGQFGNGTTTDSLVPVGTAGLSPAWIGGGVQYACAIVSGGVSCWGANGYRQLGDGTQTNRTTPVPVLLP